MKPMYSLLESKILKKNNTNNTRDSQATQTTLIKNSKEEKTGQRLIERLNESTNKISNPNEVEEVKAQVVDKIHAARKIRNKGEKEYLKERKREG